MSWDVRVRCWRRAWISGTQIDVVPATKRFELERPGVPAAVRACKAIECSGKDPLNERGRYVNSGLGLSVLRLAEAHDQTAGGRDYHGGLRQCRS